MPTQYNDSYMAITRPDAPHEQTYENLNSFRQSYKDFMADVNDKNESMNDMDFDNICRIQKQVQDHFDPITDTQQDGARSTFILKSSDEQILSQKFTQLCTTTAHKQPLMIKEIEDKLENIPDFLTKRNQTFQDMLHQALSTITLPSTSSNNTNNQNNINALRHIAILIYKIIVIQNYHRLWATYLKSGLGKLITASQQPSLPYSATVPIWPKVLKILLSSAGINKSNENEMCMNLVNQHLREFDNQLKQYQIELKIQATNFNSYTLTIQQTIEAYIEQNLSSLRMEIEHKIQLVYYDYHIRALKLEYFRQNPNEYQVQLINEVCQSEYEQETTEQELNFLKQQITYYNLPSQSFQFCSSIAYSPLIDSIENPIVRQELFKQFKEIAEQSRAALFNIYLKSAEDQREEYKKKHETNVNKMWSDYHHSIDNTRKIPRIMVQLINQRCQKINERIKCIYKFRTESFKLKFK